MFSSRRESINQSINLSKDKDGTDGQTDNVLPENSDASQEEPQRRYAPREPKAAMSKRRHMDSVEKQDTGDKKAKGKAAPAKKSRPV